MSVPAAVGIDLGTTYSCVGVFRDGKVEIIANESANRTTPSIVSFTDEERVAGENAKMQLAVNPENTVYDAKRLIGRRFEDDTVQKDVESWPFKVINDKGKPKLKVTYRGKEKIFNPEEISATVLTHMKDIAENFLSPQKIKDVVVTTPAYFNDAQRQATKDAATIAGLNVLRIINEPTAAAIAYGLDKKGAGKKTILVFDLGGGTFDVSILTIENGVFHVLATAGDTHLGGEDFDKRMVDHFIKVFEKDYKRSIKDKKNCIARLKFECERAKRMLSTSANVTFTVYGLDGIDFARSITRASFEQLNADLFRSTMPPVEKALNDANLRKSDIDDVVLVGGSTRIPKIQKLLQDFFDGKELTKSINPDEAVAYGAAVQAAALNSGQMDKDHDFLLLDVTPLSLGIGVSDGTVCVVVKRNTVIPTKHVHNFTTVEDNQESVKFEVYEGERALQKDNNFLGSFVLEGIPPAPRGVPSFNVTFELDANTILKVSAVDSSTGNKNKITIKNDENRLSKHEIERMLEDAERFRRDDERVRERASAKDALQNFVYDTKFQVEDGRLKSKISGSDKTKVVNKINETIEWIERNQRAEKDEFEYMLRKMEELCRNVFEKY